MGGALYLSLSIHRSPPSPLLHQNDFFRVLYLVPSLNTEHPLKPQGNIFVGKCEHPFYLRPPVIPNQAILSLQNSVKMLVNFFLCISMAAISFSHVLPKVKQFMTHSLGQEGCLILCNLGYLVFSQVQLSDGLTEIMVLQMIQLLIIGEGGTFQLHSLQLEQKFPSTLITFLLLFL